MGREDYKYVAIPVEMWEAVDELAATSDPPSSPTTVVRHAVALYMDEKGYVLSLEPSEDG